MTVHQRLCVDCAEPSRSPRARRCEVHHQDHRRELARTGSAKYRERHPERRAASNARQNDRNRENGYHARWHQEVGYWRAVERKYGVTRDQYEEMLTAQDGRCAICGSADHGRDGYRLVVDHDHKTGAVRGLLCNNCNRVLGYFDDDPDRMLAAAAYLLSKEDILGRVG